jgi:hypothetical protein
MGGSHRPNNRKESVMAVFVCKWEMEIFGGASKNRKETIFKWMRLAMLALWTRTSIFPISNFMVHFNVTDDLTKSKMRVRHFKWRVSARSFNQRPYETSFRRFTGYGMRPMTTMSLPMKRWPPC